MGRIGRGLVFVATLVEVNFSLIAPIADTLPRTTKSEKLEFFSWWSENTQFWSQQSENAKSRPRPSDH